MKKIFTLVMAAALILALASCSAPAEPSAEPSAPSESVSEPAPEPAVDLTADIAAVMENESDIENIWRGVGLPVGDAEYVPDENYQCFVPVTDDKFADTAALRAYTESVFTAEYAQERFYSYGLDAQTGARYKDIDGVLCEDIGQGGGLSQDWNLDSIKITEETDDMCVAEIDYINYDSTYTSVITFAKTADGPRISAMQDKD